MHHSDKQRAELEALLAKNPDIGPRELARATGVSYSTAHGWRRKFLETRPDMAIRQDEVEVPVLPDTELTIDEIRERRRQQYQQLDRAMKARRLIPVNVKIDGPIGITWFGDPHLDDDGTDFLAIERDVKLVKETPGMFAANIGDSSNNWVGRLARLYAEQSTSAKEEWKLVEWFIKELPWLIFLDGNHGAWSGAGNPVKWMLANCTSIHDETDARLELRFPNGARTTIYARHDFPGNSQWNTTHGLAKAASFGGFDDSLLVAGHTHVSGYQMVKNPKSDVVSHLLRVAGYKRWDRYAKERFFRDGRISESAVTVFDPSKPASSPSHVTVFHDVEAGADYLTHLRKKAGV